ncbi:hypothetical protein NG796_25705 [Laspinema sp. A4]|uniref:hypothetical protein n=1 Tax=Laspinema sp. D2d TaxID=2953686 RepID=UPI0021BA975A|nr:hypothetical protein [Laspinema sp. D2d]MCT7986673.1 hypothetical protein [Laspinema sp. D2d]
MNLHGIEAGITTLVISGNIILTSLCQLLAILVIGLGVTRALIIFVKDALFNPHTMEAFQRSRLVMGYSFSLLEFRLSEI